MKRRRNRPPVRALQLLLPLLLLAAMACGLVLWMTGGHRRADRRELISSMGFLGELSGFSVTTGTSGDFPSREGLPEAELKSELDRILQFADGTRFDAVFFQARADGMAFSASRYFDPHPSLSGARGMLGGFDPLDYLCTAAGGQQVQICAVVDVTAAPAELNRAAAGTKASAAGGVFDLSAPGTVELLAASTAELGERYPVTAILLTGLEDVPEQQLTAVVTAIRERLRAEAPGVVLGLLVDGDRSSGTSPAAVGRLAREKLIDLAVPRLTAPASPAAGETGYIDQLARWTGAMAGAGRLMVANPVPARPAGGSGEPEELCWQLLLSATDAGTSGTLLEHYGPLSADPERTETLAGFLAAPAAPKPALDFSLPQTLAVTYPAGDVSVTDAAVFLMGTSDPDLPLTLDGEEVARYTAGGSWGTLAKLEMGENTFTLRQGEETARVTVRRYTPGPATISDITEASVFPRFPCGVDSDAELTLSCMAPAGGTVTASLGGRSITLSQSAGADQGAPVAYRGTITLNPADYDADATTNIGPVTYRLRYNGAETARQSQGEVRVAGRNVPLMVENIAQLSSVLSDPDDDDSMIGTLKPGAVAQVERVARTSRSGVITTAYKLRGSGYILAGTPTMGEMVRVLEGSPEPVGQLTGVKNELREDGSVVITFGEGTPAVITTWGQEALTLDCLGVTGIGDLSQLKNSFVSGASSAAVTGGTRITLTLDPAGRLWGYDLCYAEGSTCLYLKPAPEAGGSFARPLSGVTVLLDPGHGGSDPGALGVAGSAGPAEAQANLAVSQAVRYRLEQLGASVYLTREDDSQVSLYQRVDAATALYPDIFLSIHHNSGVLTGNMNQARRMECYYFEDRSGPFARALMDRLPGLIGRPGTDPEQARYYVTRQTANPAVLLEVGFMVNPLEYEECIDRLTILKTACGIAQAVVDIAG